MKAHNENIDFVMKNYKMFNEGLSLYPPDTQWLIKGKFDIFYAVEVDRLLQELECIKSETKVSIALIEDSFRKSIRDVVEKKYKHSFLVSKTWALSLRGGLFNANQCDYKSIKKTNIFWLLLLLATKI